MNTSTRLLWALLIPLLALTTACGARSKSRASDLGSARLDGPQIRLDGPQIRLDGPQIRLDGPTPPPLDQAIPPLDGPGIKDGPQNCSNKTGAPCSSATSCCAGLSCVPIYTGAQICAPSCTPDDPHTPLVNEDTCKSNYACANVSLSGFQFACLPKCDPTLGKNDCETGISCDPRTNQLTFELQSAFCAGVACTSNNDCPIRSAVVCQVGGPNTCAAQGPSRYCAPDERGATSGPGHCATPGNCDLKSGLCAPHKQGKPSAKIGDPCKNDRDCGGRMRCLMEQADASGRLVQRNGYCTIDGCAFASTLKERSCPSNATCQLLYPGGRCFLTCDHQKAASCRGYAPDQLGDYECYAWNNLVMGGNKPIASHATCEPALYSCDFFATSGLDCSALGLQNNPTNMRCRDPQTNAALPPGSFGGVCLDDTSS